MLTVSDDTVEKHVRIARAWRIGWTAAAILVVQTIVCGLAALPVVAVWLWLLDRLADMPALRAVVLAVLAMPSSAIFALGLMGVSAPGS
jgi:hypothetical protein